MRNRNAEMARISDRFPGVEWIDGAGTFIRIDEKKCTGCGNCIKVCLGRCFEIEKKLARIKSLDECMECASCWYVCGEGAIGFSWPPGGTGYRSDWG
jgi:NAD-dependent dihydropyrimidine dehydrogenase PreA subunit